MCLDWRLFPESSRCPSVQWVSVPLVFVWRREDIHMQLTEASPSHPLESSDQKSEENFDWRRLLFRSHLASSSLIIVVADLEQKAYCLLCRRENQHSLPEKIHIRFFSSESLSNRWYKRDDYDSLINIFAIWNRKERYDSQHTIHMHQRHKSCRLQQEKPDLTRNKK